MVKTLKPILPQNYRFGHIGPDLVQEMILINVWNIYKEIKWFLGSLPSSQCGGQFALVEHFVFVDLSLN